MTTTVANDGICAAPLAIMAAIRPVAAVVRKSVNAVMSKVIHALFIGSVLSSWGGRRRREAQHQSGERLRAITLGRRLGDPERQRRRLLQRRERDGRRLHLVTHL